MPYKRYYPRYKRRSSKKGLSSRRRTHQRTKHRYVKGYRKTVFPGGTAMLSRSPLPQKMNFKSLYSDLNQGITSVASIGAAVNFMQLNGAYDPLSSVATDQQSMQYFNFYSRYYSKYVVNFVVVDLLFHDIEATNAYDINVCAVPSDISAFPTNQSIEVLSVLPGAKTALIESNQGNTRNRRKLQIKMNLAKYYKRENVNRSQMEGDETSNPQNGSLLFLKIERTDGAATPTTRLKVDVKCIFYGYWSGLKTATLVN